MKKNRSAKLTINNKSYLLPIYKASEGSDVIDITKLYAESNHFTYDPGFTSTASCQSNITFIDGEKGILRYRGYDIEDLAKNSDFIEVTNLLILNTYNYIIWINSCIVSILIFLRNSKSFIMPYITFTFKYFSIFWKMFTIYYTY